MKRIHFLVTDELNQQIEKIIRLLGIYSKSEFFRILALECIKENQSASQKSLKTTPDMPKLSPKEAIIMAKLYAKAKTIDDLTGETGLRVSEVSSLLVQLLLKNLVIENGLYWKLI